MNYSDIHYRLGILIPTIFGREYYLEKLSASIKKHGGVYVKEESIENNLHFSICKFPYIETLVIIALDGKVLPIGSKRNQLYAKCTAEYSWQIDDDDAIAPDAIPLIREAMASEPDCITFEEACTIDGVAKRSNFSLQYADWGDDQDGYDYVRTPFFKTPIKTSICQQVPVPAMRFGEDHAWAQLIKPLLQTEVHIDKPLYYYQHRSSPFAERYGFDKEK